MLVAVLGTPHSPAGALSAFRNGWEVIAGTALLAAVAGGVLLAPARGRRERPVPGAAEAEAS